MATMKSTTTKPTGSAPTSANSIDASEAKYICPRCLRGSKLPICVNWTCPKYWEDMGCVFNEDAIPIQWNRMNNWQRHFLDLECKRYQNLDENNSHAMTLAIMKFYQQE